jgi:hypothetical protein
MHRSKDTAEPEPVADLIPGSSTSKMAPRRGLIDPER